MARQFDDHRSAASLILASACWGIATVTCKGLLSPVSPITLLVSLLAPSVILLWLVALMRPGKIPAWRSLLPLGSLGIVNSGISYTLSLMGLQQSAKTVRDTSLSQLGIDRAFAGKHRQSNLSFENKEFMVTILAGKNTGRPWVESSAHSAARGVQKSMDDQLPPPAGVSIVR